VLIRQVEVKSVNTHLILYDKEVFTMSQGGSKYFKLKINTQTGDVVEKEDENKTQATMVPQSEIDSISENQGFKFIGVLLQAQTNPTCIYFVHAGTAYKVCF
jgi:hypothetical protein